MMIILRVFMDFYFSKKEGIIKYKNYRVRIMIYLIIMQFCFFFQMIVSFFGFKIRKNKII
jgi:hypothetical protein